MTHGLDLTPCYFSLFVNAQMLVNLAKQKSLLGNTSLAGSHCIGESNGTNTFFFTEISVNITWPSAFR